MDIGLACVQNGLELLMGIKMGEPNTNNVIRSEHRHLCDITGSPKTFNAHIIGAGLCMI